MSKVLSPHELARIVTDLLTTPGDVGELDTEVKYTTFIQQLAEQVCEFCGGYVSSVSGPEYIAEEAKKAGIVPDDCETEWCVHIRGDDSLPDPETNIWTHHGFDPDGELFEEEEGAA